MENSPLFSRRVSAGTRVYYIDCLKDRKGQKFLKISEIPTDKNTCKKSRQHIFIHECNIEAFVKQVVDVAGFINNEIKR